MRRNPRPIPLSEDVVQSIRDAVVAAIKTTIKGTGRDNDVLLLAARDPKALIPVGTFPAPIYMGKRGWLYREIPVILAPQVPMPKQPAATHNFIQSAGILFNQSDLYANPEVLIIRYHPMYPVADIRRGKLWGNYFFESKLRDAIVHELTHASDFQRTAGGNHKQAIDAPAAYYNSPTEVRAYMQGSVDMLKREAHDLKTNRMGRGERDWLRDWMRAAKHGILAHWDLLTPRNQQRFLRALYQAGVEAGLPP